MRWYCQESSLSSAVASGSINSSSSGGSNNGASVSCSEDEILSLVAESEAVAAEAMVEAEERCAKKRTQGEPAAT